MRLSVFIVIIIIMVIPLHSFAASSKSKNKNDNHTKSNSTNQTSDKSRASITYDINSFDIAVNVLPKHYNGHNFVNIANKLSSVKFNKDEFETTSQYDIRKSDIINNLKLDGSLNMNSMFSFTRNTITNVGYNADKGELSYLIAGMEAPYPLGSKLKYIKPGEPSVNGGYFSVNIISEKASYYVGENAFGATSKVQKKEIEEAAIAFRRNFSNEGEFTSLGKNKWPIVFVLRKKMLPDEAKSAKQNARILFVGTLVDPFVGSFGKQSKPTRDMPIEKATAYNCLALDIKEVWMFNYETGEIYQKLKL